MAATVRRAIIAGGGIGGLSAAIALRRIGVDVTVYEQAGELAPAGAGLTLWANAIRALRALDLAEAVIESGCRIREASIHTSGGRVLARTDPGELERRYGEPTIAIHRAELHRILLASLPAGVVRLGSRCSAFEQDADSLSVHVDGYSDRADLLIGADGIHSTLRAQLFPQVQPRYAGYTAWRGVVEAQSDMALGTTSESWGRGARFGIVPIDAKRVYWFATANGPAGLTRTAGEHKTELLRRFKGWHPPIERLLEATPADAILHNDILDLRPTQTWGRGRVILLGDAIHATTPNMGQGACMAIESSVVLARCLAKEQDSSAALRRYQAERIPRTAWVTERSWQIGRVAQLENRLVCAVREGVMLLTPTSVMRKQLEQVIASFPASQPVPQARQSG